MKRARALIVLLSISTIQSSLCAQASGDEWITILIHGAIGLAANLSSNTVSRIKRDIVEGSSYERNVKAIRNHPYLFALQPIGKLGLHPVKKADVCINAASIFSELYTDMTDRYLGKENNTFYTFGWSGLVSKKQRYCAARDLYCELKEFITTRTAAGKKPKVRLIAYSHGATMIFNFAQLRATEFCEDTFVIDETITIGLPVNRMVTKASRCKPFQKIYHIYSMGDKIQRLDVFTSTYLFSERTFKGRNLDNITQIELRYTAPLHPMPGRILPSGMRGMINQAPGHVEFWSFGWTQSMYRKNLDMYPLSGAVFIPFLLHAADVLPKNHIQVDIRPGQEKALVQSLCGGDTVCVPFMTCPEYAAFLKKALSFHPHNPKHRAEFAKLESSVDIKAYK